MAIYVSAYTTERRSQDGGTHAHALRISPTDPGAGFSNPEEIAVNHIGEAYAVMRALRTGLRFDLAAGRDLRNRIARFTLRGDVNEEFTRAEVEALPVNAAQPGHPQYAAWRAARIEADESRAVEGSRLLSPELARALGIKGVHEWADVTRVSGPAPERVDDTTAAMLEAGGEPVYVRRLPERHPVHPGKRTRQALAVGQEGGPQGYWFTVPADFPASRAAHVSSGARETFAVYQSPYVVTGYWVWVMTAATPGARILGSSSDSRREAVREGLAKLAELRRAEAAQITDVREAALELPAERDIRIAAPAGGWVLHVRCACEVDENDLLGRVQFIGEAAELIGTTPDPWRLCVESPNTLLGTDSELPVARITRSGGRTGDGQPSLSVTDMDGGRPAAMRLVDLAGSAL